MPRVKPDRAQSYFNIACFNRWFCCPALPFRVAFERPKFDADAFEPTLPRAIRNQEALEAYVDLVQTAEYALPIGSDAYRYPLASSLWRKVQLGKKYCLGSDSTETAVLLTLEGHSDGYLIEDCRIASAEEFRDYETRLSRWRMALNWYYDVYAD